MANKTEKSNYQRYFTYKFDSIFFSFLFDSNKIFNNLNESNKSEPDENISILAIHVYACILNESMLNNVNQLNNSFQNDNLLRAITPLIVEFLFETFKDNTDNELNNFYNSETDNAENCSLKKRLFHDRKLIVCRCLPLIINVLHLSLPDKRLVDLGAVLDKSMTALERVQRADIKLEFVKAFLNMLSECSDRAALKIVIVSKRFFICLLEQLRFICLTCNPTTTTTAQQSKSQKSNGVDNFEFLHEYVRVTLSLIKNLLDNSESVKVKISFCYNNSNRFIIQNF